MGIPLTTFIHRVRIGHASRLLSESDEKVVDIALESGYANLSNFNRWFLAIKGETPSAFRTKWRAAEMTNKSEVAFRRASRFFRAGKWDVRLFLLHWVTLTLARPVFWL
jgi:AraC-like DNA-binding protein